MPRQWAWISAWAAQGSCPTDGWAARGRGPAASCSRHTTLRGRLELRIAKASAGAFGCQIVRSEFILIMAPVQRDTTSPSLMPASTATGLSSGGRVPGGLGQIPAPALLAFWEGLEESSGRQQRPGSLGPCGTPSRPPQRPLERLPVSALFNVASVEVQCEPSVAR